ncbi:MAG: diacylglycerol/lipid kinase family protein [Candidatus Promineifilaceae bacterium]|jgi:diacylglycerol kinase (ATP)
MSSTPYQRIHVVINPASGKDEPILNVLNDVFSQHGLEWDISLTKKYGDATEFARKAAESGDYDLVAGYGGDGTQHEIANGVMDTGVAMGVLPGGTGNGFCTELGIPDQLRPAVELLCGGSRLRKIDIARVDGDGREPMLFVQRLYTGIEPESQTSREEKDHYGTFAYVRSGIQRLRQLQNVPYTLTIDGQKISEEGVKCYVVNSAMAGTGISIDPTFAIDDGLLDVFIVGKNFEQLASAGDRLLHLRTRQAGLHVWHGKEITIDAAVDQPVWTDGEYYGRTPVSISVLPGAFNVVVPA